MNHRCSGFVFVFMRPKGTAAALEARRRYAAALLRDGKSLAETAELVGASMSSVKRWRKALREDGEEALAAKPHPGPAERLSDDQKRRLTEILCRGASAAGYRTELWTCRRIAQVVKKHFGVAYHPGHVWRILRSLNWSPQRPERRARERDEQAVANWRRKEWPRIKKGRRRSS